MEHYGTLNDAENNYEQTQEYNADMKIFIERNREIEALVNSITDLNQIFKDLSMMVNEQIESIDRIDLSMSETKTKTDSGIGELKKAQEEQKKCHIQ
jgi:t-SNARE complex subunit (syntaxin)